MPRPRVRIPNLLHALVLGLLTAPPLHAQAAALVLEVQGGVAAPLSPFSDGTAPGEGTTAGPSLSIQFLRPGAGRTGVYVGFSHHRFGCEAAGCGADGRYVATGFDLGLRLALARVGPVVPWIRAGAITTRVETDDLGGADAGVSKLGFGGEVGAGLLIGAASPVAISPGVRYALVATELPGGATLDMRYLVAQVAVALAF